MGVLVLFIPENLFLRARSETLGYAIIEVEPVLPVVRFTRRFVAVSHSDLYG